MSPPDIDPVERSLPRSWRAWPTWGLALWLLAQLALGPDRVGAPAEHGPR